MPRSTRSMKKCLRKSATDWALYVILALTICSCDDKSTPPPEMGSVYGTVTVVGTGTAISGAIVRCGGKSTTTDQTGEYELEDIEVGSHELTVSKSDFEDYASTVNIRESGTRHNIQMTSNVQGASVWGYVRHTSGSVVVGATVTIAGLSDHTDATGRYQLPSVPQGNQVLEVAATGYETFSETFYMFSSDKQIDLSVRKYYSTSPTITMDAFVWSRIPNSNFNTGGVCTAHWPIPSGEIFREEILIQAAFSLPGGAEVDSVLLDLATSKTSMAKVDFKIHAIYESWNDQTVTWYTKPESSPAMSAPCLSSDLITDCQSRRIWRFDLSGVFQDYWNSASQYGVRLYIPAHPDGYTRSICFDSSEELYFCDTAPQLRFVYLK